MNYDSHSSASSGRSNLAEIGWQSRTSVLCRGTLSKGLILFCIMILTGCFALFEHGDNTSIEIDRHTNNAHTQSDILLIHMMCNQPMSSPVIRDAPSLTSLYWLIPIDPQLQIFPPCSVSLFQVLVGHPR